MDSLLIVGSCEPRLRQLFGKLGYRLIDAAPDRAIPELIRQEVVDLIVLDTSLHGDPLELCEFFRSDPSAKQIPLVCLAASEAQHTTLAEAAFPFVESIPPPHSNGGIVGRIATLLRLRKIAGEEKGAGATLHEMNARLRDLTDHFTRELEEAREIQRSLLPTELPRDPRFAVAASYDPLNEVGGDWYTVEREESGRIRIHIADASGHGLSAAFLSSMTKLAQRAVGEVAPAPLLAGMNRLMTPLMPAGKFITSAVASYAPGTGTLAFARAGHPPGLVFRRQSGTIEELRGDGFAIGFLEDSDYTPVETNLAVGDIFVLYTDGLTEGQNRDQALFGTEGVTQALRGLPPQASAADALRAIVEQFELFLDGRAVKDDVTILALKRLTE